VMHPDGSNERIGPYEFVKAIDGALFTPTDYLGAFAVPPSEIKPLEVWREVAFLPTE
jgi:hypothetical protein